MKTLLGEHLHFDWKIVTVIVVSTLLLIVDFVLSTHAEQRL